MTSPAAPEADRSPVAKARQALSLGRVGGALAVAVLAGGVVSEPLVGVAVLLAIVGVGFLGVARRDIAPLLGFLAILFVTSPRYQFQVFRFPAGILAALALTGLWLLGRAAEPVPEGRGDRRVSLAILGLTLAFLTSYVLGIARPLRIQQLEAGDRDVIILFALCGVAMFVSDIGRTKQYRALIAGTLVAAACFSALGGVVQQVIHFDISNSLGLPGFRDAGLFTSGAERLGYVRAHGTARHPIEFGTSLALALPFALHFGAYGLTHRSKVLANVATALLLAGMTISLSRSAIVALVMLLVTMVPTWSSRRRWATVGLATVLLTLVLAWQPQRLVAATDLVFNWRGEEIEGVGIESRTADYEVVAQLVRRHPLLGEGYGVHAGVDTFATDNEYLDTAIETGIVGIIALLAVFIVPFRAAGRAKEQAEQNGDRSERDFAVAIRAALTATIVCLGTYDGLSFSQFAFSAFTIVGLSGAMLRRTPAPLFTQSNSTPAEPPASALRKEHQ